LTVALKPRPEKGVTLVWPLSVGLGGDGRSFGRRVLIDADSIEAALAEGRRDRIPGA